MQFYPGEDVGVIDCQKAYKVFADAAAYKVSQPPVLPLPASWHQQIRHYLCCTCQRQRTQKFVACNGSGSGNENSYGSGNGNTNGISNGNGNSNSSSTICSRRDNLPAITKLPVHVCSWPGYGSWNATAILSLLGCVFGGGGGGAAAEVMVGGGWMVGCCCFAANHSCQHKLEQKVQTECLAKGCLVFSNNWNFCSKTMLETRGEIDPDLLLLGIPFYRVTPANTTWMSIGFYYYYWY